MRSYIYIPPSERVARQHVDRWLAGKPEELPKADFMKAYCSLAFLYPGFHPDEIANWQGPGEATAMGEEAWRRAEAGELTDNELYPYQATKARFRLVRRKMQV